MSEEGFGRLAVDSGAGSGDRRTTLDGEPDGRALPVWSFFGMVKSVVGGWGFDKCGREWGGGDSHPSTPSQFI